MTQPHKSYSVLRREEAAARRNVEQAARDVVQRLSGRSGRWRYGGVLIPEPDADALLSLTDYLNEMDGHAAEAAVSP